MPAAIGKAELLFRTAYRRRVTFGIKRQRALPHAVAKISVIASIAEKVQMASSTIRNLDEALKRKLRLRAARRNRSMEDEARDILHTALAEGTTSRGNLADAMRRRFEPLRGVDLALPPRGPMREPPDFT